ncbi:coiled-coil domain-containing protein [Mycoplasmopsis glycophila]|uniref:Uncharacterized protein n=1 Tax=Mycoplasmopsis glycophila TaxID=171285 RepID=A0A449AV87_9BACT|nr:hypothetical protein [Mycoplasmopsis glycophila]VEU70382.1 Uncharacterised protein [Mycoplasmopsis glycophila]
MKKSKTLSKAVILGTSLAAAGLGGVILALHEGMKKDKPLAFQREFGQVKEFEAEVLNFLQSTINPETNESSLSKEAQEEIYEILLEIKLSKENPETNSLSAQELTNKLGREFAYTKLKEAIRNGSQEDVKEALNQITNEIKDPELKEQFLQNSRDVMNSIQNGDLNKEDKIKLANQLKEQSQNVFEKQNDIIVPAQNILWKIKDELAAKPENYKPEDKAKAQAIIHALEGALDQNVLSAENVSQLTEALVDTYNDLMDLKKETELEYQKYLSKSEATKQKVLESKLSNEDKNKLLDKINAFNDQAGSKDLVYANNKYDELKELEKALDQLAQEMDDKNKDNDVIREEIETILSSAATLSHQNLNNTLANEIAKLRESLSDPKLTKDQLIELKKDAQSKIEYAKTNQNSIDRTNDLIDRANANQLITEAQKNELKAEIESINGDDLASLTKDENAKIDDVIEKLTRAQRVNDELNRLKGIVDEKIQSPYADHEVLNAILSEIAALQDETINQWDDLDSEKDLTWRAEDKINELFDKLRDANKNELKNLIAKGQEAQNNPDVAPSIKNSLKALETISTPLTNEYSSATNKQIDPKIKEYKKLLDDARLSDKVSKINNETNAFKDTIAAMPTDNNRNDQADIYKAKIDSLLNRINVIHSTPNKSNAQKEEEIDALYEQIKAIEASQKDLQRLMDEQNVLVNILNDLDNDPEIKRQILSEVNEANALLDSQNNVFRKPGEYDIDREIEKLKELEDLIKDKKAKIVSDQYYTKTLKQINSAFSPYRDGVLPSALETKFKNELENLKAILDDPNTDSKAYDDAVEAIRNLQANIQAAADLEKARRALKDEIQRTEDMGLGTYKPQDQVDAANAKLAKIDDFIANLGSPSVGPLAYEELKNEAMAQKDGLQIAQEKAKFDKALDNLKKYITPSEETDSELSKELEAKITENIKVAQEKAESIVGPINEIEKINTIKLTAEQVKNNIPLAAKLKEAQARYKELTAKDPMDEGDQIIANQLKDVIEANLMNLGDSPTKINEKIENIIAELNKIQAKQEALESLKEFEKIYTDADSPKAIFADSKQKWDQQLAEFKERFADPNQNLDELIKLKKDIDRALSEDQTEKDRLEKELKDTYNKADELYTQLKLQNPLKDPNNPSELAENSKLKGVWDEIAALKDESGNFVDGATPQKIEELIDKMRIENLKDIFNSKKDTLDKRLEGIQGIEGHTEPVDSLKNKVSTAAGEWSKLVNNQDTDLNELTEEQLKEYIQKLDSLDSYTEEAKALVDAYPNSKNPEEIDQAINNNLIDPTDGVIDIKEKTKNLRDARYGAKEEEELRKEVQSKLDALDEEVKSESNLPDDAYAKDQLAELDQLIDSKKEALAAAKGKDAIRAIEEKATKIKENLDAIKDFAKKVYEFSNKADEAITQAAPGDAVALENLKARFKEDLEKAAKKQYTNPDSKVIQDLIKKQENYSSLLKSIQDFNTKYNATKDKLNNLNYGDGFGVISGMNFKLSDDAQEESFSSLTKDDVKTKMLESLAVLKTFSENIDYSNTEIDVLDLKKELALINVSLNNFDQLVDKQKEALEKVKTISDDATAKKDQFQTLNVNDKSLIEDYGYEFDKKNVGETILNSGIVSKQNSDNLPSDSVENIENKYRELQSLNASIKSKINSDKAILDNKTLEIDSLNDEIVKLNNQITYQVKEWEIAKERITELEAQNSYTTEDLTTKIESAKQAANLIKEEIVSKLTTLKQKEQDLQNKQNELEKAFYQIQYDLQKYKENLDLQNKLSEILFEYATNQVVDQRLSTKSKALGWKNQVLINKANDLESEIEQKQELYTQRQVKIKAVKDSINTLNSEDVLPVLVSDATSSNNQKAQEKYKLANEKISNLYLDILKYISKAYSTTQLDDYNSYIDSVNKVPNSYKAIANKIYELETKIEEIKNNADIKDNLHIKSLVGQIESEINYIKGQLQADSNNLSSLYQANTDQNFIKQWDDLLAFQIRKLAFYEKYANSQKELDDRKDSSTAATAGTVQFTEAEWRPLQNILNTIFEEMYYTNSYYKEDELEKDFVQKYLTAQNDTSFKTALANSIQLKEIITKAQRIYDARKVINEDGVTKTNDTREMNNLYDKLIDEITKAQAQLTNINHNEISKSLEIDKIDDSSTGLIAQLKDQKLKELRKQLSLAKDINSYLESNYNFANGPKNPDFKAKAVDKIEDLVNNPLPKEEEFITKSNELIEESKTAIKDQLYELFEYEKKALKNLIVKSKQYAQVYSGVSLGDDLQSKSTELAKLLNVSNADVEKLIQLIKQIPDQGNFDVSTWNIESEYSSPAQDKNLSKYQDNEYADYKGTIRKIKERKTDLNSKYTYLKQTTTLRLKSFKTEFDSVIKEFEPITTQDGSSNLRTILDDMEFNSKSGDYLTSFLDKSSYETNTQNVDGASPLVEPDDSADKDKLIDSKDKFLKFANAILEQNSKWNKLIFGTTSNDDKALKNIYKNYIDQRSQIDNYLDKWLETRQLDQKDAIFQRFLELFNVQKDQAQKIKTNIYSNMNMRELDDSNLETPSAILRKVKRALLSAKTFRDWLNNPVNKQELFDYLYKKPANDSTSYHFNYNDLELVDGKYADDWAAEINKISSFETIQINGEDKDAILVNDTQPFLNLFKRFSIVKQNPKIFNGANVKVYLYKNKDADSKILEEIIQANPSYKNVKYNLMIKFTWPATQNQDSVFNDTGDATVYWGGVESRFKTYSEIKINNNWFSTTKGFYKGDWSTKMYENWKNTSVENLPGAILFDYSKGGLTPETAPGVIVSGYNDLQSLYNEQTYLPMYSAAKITELKTKTFNMSDPFVGLDPNLSAAKARVQKYPHIEQATQWTKEVEKWKRTLDIQKERININISVKNNRNFTYKGKNYAKSADLTFWRLLPSDNYGSLSYIPHLIAIPVYDVNSKKMGIILWLFQIVPSSNAKYFIAGMPWENRMVAYVSNSYTYSDTDAQQNYTKSLEMAKDVLSKYVNKDIAYKIDNTTGGPKSKTDAFWNVQESGTYITSKNSSGASNNVNDSDGMTFGSTGFVNTFDIDYTAKIYKSDLELQNNEEGGN